MKSELPLLLGWCLQAVLVPAAWECHSAPVVESLWSFCCPREELAGSEGQAAGLGSGWLWVCFYYPLIFYSQWPLLPPVCREQQRVPPSRERP